jgi:hypothetical protein
MKLAGLYLTEGYGRVWRGQYSGYQTDPRPKVLILGHWRNPSTGNDLVGGINLNYLSDEEIIELQKALKQILRSHNLKNRYWTGRRLLPDIFGSPGRRRYYRTYKKDLIHSVTPETLKFYLEPKKPKSGLTGPTGLGPASPPPRKPVL